MVSVVKKKSKTEKGKKKEQEKALRLIKEEQFWEIVENELIYPVYQPIVSLRDGEVMGYEALSRISMENCLINTEEFFHMAQRMDSLWRVEALCRRKSLQNALDKKAGIKLFLNVDPDVIKDPQFKEGVTCQFLRRYKLMPEDIVFEITERNSIQDEEAFRGVIRHYQNQTFQIAIDDFGNGYAGMNRICALEPEYIKIDMEIVRGIDKDNLKKSLVESMIQFCKKNDIYLIAEGIETREEMLALIKLGVPYGQGYFLLRPQPRMREITPELRDYICNAYDAVCSNWAETAVLGTVGEICSRREVTVPDRPAKEIYEYFKERPAVTEITVLDPDEKVLGVLTRAGILAEFGGMYGYDLSRKKKVREFMDEKPLLVDVGDSVEKVSRKALMRPQRTLYDAVIVTKDDKYCGVVTVKDLLEAAIAIKVHRAVDTNPLTGLPGNMVIDEKIEHVVPGKKSFSIIYVDLDNFKAYNDAYGFNNGDLMIKALAESMKECCIQNEFIGHIGGDDFVIITDQWNIQCLLKSIVEEFQRRVVSLYSSEDYARGYIVSKNRHGEQEKFPVASLSMAVVTNRRRRYKNMDEFSEQLVKAKKKSKAIAGSSYVFAE